MLQRKKSLGRQRRTSRSQPTKRCRRTLGCKDLTPGTKVAPRVTRRMQATPSEHATVVLEPMLLLGKYVGSCKNIIHES